MKLPASFLSLLFTCSLFAVPEAFEVGPEQTVAFFEYKNHKAKAFAKPAGVPDPRAIQFDHLSLNVADEHALEELQVRLKAHGCEVTDVVDHEVMIDPRNTP